MNIPTPHNFRRYGIRTLLILTVWVLTALPSFSDDSYILQYTSDRTNPNALVTADAESSVEFTQGAEVYLKVTPEPEAADSTLTVLQRNTETQEDVVLTPDDSSYYTLDTKTIGSYQILVNQTVCMKFTVTKKKTSSAQPAQTKPTKTAKKSKSKARVFKKGKYYFYKNSKGKVRKSKGFVTWKGNRYYIRKGGHIRTGKTFKIGKHTYRAAKDGRIKMGVYKWGKYYYYSTGTGKLRKKAGFFSWKGHRYYSRKNGTLYVNRFYFHGDNMYYAGSNAAARTGTFKVGKYEYTADLNGIITTSSRKYMRGIDVSYYQGKNINWAKVKASGISFAFLRCGYSGTKNGSRNKDSTFQGNIKGATAAGVDVGAYYFSQAITTKEAIAEADYAIKQVQDSGCKLTLPLVIDTENISGRASSSKLSKAKRTQVIKAFCDRVKAKGYTPMIYASTSWLNNNLDMTKLSGYKVWVAQYYDKVTYKGKYQCWQYTSSGKVSGISGRVDLNYWVL